MLCRGAQPPWHSAHRDYVRIGRYARSFRPARCELGLRRRLAAGRVRVQNHVFAPETVARGGFDGEDRIERERASFALGRAGDGGSLEALGDAEYHLVLEYKIGGPLTYVTASTHCKRFADIAVDHVLLNLSHVTRIDLDGIAALEVVCARRGPWEWPGSGGGGGSGCWRVIDRALLVGESRWKVTASPRVSFLLEGTCLLVCLPSPLPGGSPSLPVASSVTLSEFLLFLCTHLVMRSQPTTNDDPHHSHPCPETSSSLRGRDYGVWRRDLVRKEE
jgi:hypothetical protein